LRLLTGIGREHHGEIWGKPLAWRPMVRSSRASIPVRSASAKSTMPVPRSTAAPRNGVAVEIPG
jgi:hypothetical protein